MNRQRRELFASSVKSSLFLAFFPVVASIQIYPRQFDDKDTKYILFFKEAAIGKILQFLPGVFKEEVHLTFLFGVQVVF